MKYYSKFLTILSDRPKLKEFTPVIDQYVRVMNSYSLDALVSQRQGIQNLFQVLPRYEYDRGFIAKNGNLELILDPLVHSSHQDKMKTHSIL